MNEIDLLEKELELKRVQVAKDTLTLDVIKKKKDIERLNKNIEIQNQKEKELIEEIEKLKGE